MDKYIFSENIESYRNDLHQLALAILGNESDAQDAVSNAIVRALENIDRLKDESKFRPWMFTITKNEALKIKKKVLELPGDNKLESLLEPVNDTYNELSDVLDKMSPEQRTVVVLYYYEGMSIKDISILLDIPVGTVKSRLTRGRSFIKGELQVDENKRKKRNQLLVLVLVISLATVAFSSRDTIAHMKVFVEFKESLKSFFGLQKEVSNQDDSDTQGILVDSIEEYIETDYSVSKPDILIELNEKIIDSQGIYLLVKVTAPSDIKFDESIGFDYVAFCEGDNYNADKLISGAKDCSLLEVSQIKDNVATYVCKIVPDIKISDGQNITISFKNLVRDPNEDAQVLVEGMWSVNFSADYTIKKVITNEETQNVSINYMGDKAVVESYEITPAGMKLVIDASNIPYDDFAVNDTNCSLVLRLIDGTKIDLYSVQNGWAQIIDSSSDYLDIIDNKTIMTKNYSFKQLVDINKIIGFYVEDEYIEVQ